MTLQRKNEPGGRSLMLTIRVSPEEKKALQVKANAMKVSVSRMVIDTCLGTNDAIQAQIWRNELQGLRRQASESGCTPELEARIMELLRKIDG